MDVDNPYGTDNFYDKIESLISPPGDYNLDDIEEILRSTDTQLDASLNFSSFDSSNDLYNFDIRNEFKTDFSLPNFTSTLEEDNNQRTLSASTSDDDGFNPDDFIKFLNDDSMKVDDFTVDSDFSNNGIDTLPHRNTPSPTGSCSSSGGSSTSGIQSDASSVGSMTPGYAIETKSITLMDNNLDLISAENGNNTSVATVLPISMPMLSIQPTLATTTTSTVLQQVPQINIVPQGTNIIPIKTVPIQQTVSQFNNTIKPIIIPAPVKIETKLAPKPKMNNINTNSVNSGKVTSPSNAKPKTIFLSSNDFKTLMQRMNSNGGKGGAKITGAVNTQMPKIVMKGPNGKVITTTTATTTNNNNNNTNKIVQPLTNINNKTTNARFVSKIVSPNGSHVVIQQPKMQQHATAKTDAAPSTVYKGIIDEKLFKKQQRMIKNRESASLSRKKKKEYVVSLETRINNLEKENYTLKGENKSLRSQLVAFAQTCHCKHNNISEFILNTLNAVENKPQHVKIAPKPAPKSLKQRMTAASIRKNVAVLFAMAFMVTLNVGNFQHFLNKNALETSMTEQSVEEQQQQQQQPLPLAGTSANGRRLLWVETEAEHNEKLNRSKRDDVEVDVPPLHFLHPINRTANGQHRNSNTTCGDQTMPPDIGVGGSGMNQTENLRLASSLRKWIGGNANYLNLSLDEKFANDELENPSGFKVTPDYIDMKTYDLPLQQRSAGGNPKRKYYVDERLMYGNGNGNGNGNKQRKMETETETDNEIDHSSLELFKPKISDEYLRLFKGIKRQDDTFYVLSFNMDHILLPASSYNKSSRPKMALMLPAGDPSLNGDIKLMQIDCEVTNTTELMLKSYMIPEKLRPSKFAKNGNDVANNETAAGTSTQQQKSYTEQSATQSNNNEQPLKAAMNISDKLITKQKPIVRTFYLMGPKTQAAADAAKKKPTIIKLNGNETLVNGVLSMKNSTLFSKMRETTKGDIVP